MKAKFVNVQLDSVEVDLTFTESSVLSYLARLSMKKKDYVYATTKHLSETFGVSQRTILRILNVLEENNLIKRVTQSVGNTGKERKIYVSPRVKQSHNYI
jgi:DNA-binding MarR family transcriptional regulator